MNKNVSNRIIETDTSTATLMLAPTGKYKIILFLFIFLFSCHNSKIYYVYKKYEHNKKIKINFDKLHLIILSKNNYSEKSFLYENFDENDSMYIITICKSKNLYNSYYISKKKYKLMYEGITLIQK